MSHPTKVLFVCLGNICRSPAAEIIFHQMVEQAQQAHRFEIDSAGTSGYHQGEPPDSRMSATLTRRGYHVFGRSRKFTASDLQTFDLIVPMDQTNEDNIRSLDPAGNYHHKIKPLVSFCKKHSDTHVPDPYYGGQQGFDHVIDLLEDGCAEILRAYQS